jgi:hypothetical protein
MEDSGDITEASLQRVTCFFALWSSSNVFSTTLEDSCIVDIVGNSSVGTFLFHKNGWADNNSHAHAFDRRFILYVINVPQRRLRWCLTRQYICI